ncbi:hypothetical protein A5788_21745 [Gordonia sp. 852002-50816_SCH5313054-c]|nr:hypothetical protein A5788_21745 [Gordonia sp. 852002-50816_SCH5313054-c]
MVSTPSAATARMPSNCGKNLRAGPLDDEVICVVDGSGTSPGYGPSHDAYAATEPAPDRRTAPEQ